MFGINICICAFFPLWHLNVYEELWMSTEVKSDVMLPNIDQLFRPADGWLFFLASAVLIFLINGMKIARYYFNWFQRKLFRYRQCGLEIFLYPFITRYKGRPSQTMFITNLNWSRHTGLHAGQPVWTHDLLACRLAGQLACHPVQHTRRSEWSKIKLKLWIIADEWKSTKEGHYILLSLGYTYWAILHNLLFEEDGQPFVFGIIAIDYLIATSPAQHRW